MHRGAWPVALDLLDAMRPASAEDAVRCTVWRARCEFQLGRYAAAQRTAALAVTASGLSDDALAQYARLMMVRAMRRAGQLPAASRLLAQWVKDFPDNPQFKLLFADFLTRSSGDWGLAMRVLRSLHPLPGLDQELACMSIRSRLYNGTLSSEQLARDIHAFADKYLSSPATLPHIDKDRHSERGWVAGSTRRRIGLVSGLLKASPVYFLCIGALRELAREHDLVFFARDSAGDWASEHFREIACEWHDVTALSPEALAMRLEDSRLYAILDLCGWLDPPVLKALARRPVERQFKWVGGQFATTGTHAFDGFISDIHQSPAHTAALYTEPLALMPGGYASFTPAPYMPMPSPPSNGQRAARVAGVISHPIKVSGPFLAYLADQISWHEQRGGEPIRLRFIGSRYAQAPLQRRIHNALGLGDDLRRGPVSVEYLSTRGHQAHLQAIAELDWVIDTFPFTCGFTALETLALGVPLRTQAGAHFSARHAYSHARFSGLSDEQIDLRQIGAFHYSPLVKTGVGLLPDACPRKDHSRLARDLARLLHAGSASAFHAHP